MSESHVGGRSLAVRGDSLGVDGALLLGGEEQPQQVVQQPVPQQDEARRQEATEVLVVAWETTRMSGIERPSACSPQQVVGAGEALQQQAEHGADGRHGGLRQRGVPQETGGARRERGARPEEQKEEEQKEEEQKEEEQKEEEQKEEEQEEEEQEENETSAKQKNNRQEEVASMSPPEPLTSKSHSRSWKAVELGMMEVSWPLSTVPTREKTFLILATVSVETESA
ncbi:hypothetical protein EYF80_042675 [Liparis tanakae]|uniref:Uncharacterized protein n=1 Tax=Liparis tanakae TaxID=230148 RepID=A0A4Z2G0R7_9TELE|nr:hypothetical protein EYF80_042675 [Liparis tanakae]